jgi:hypothetical protein
MVKRSFIEYGKERFAVAGDSPAGKGAASGIRQQTGRNRGRDAKPSGGVGKRSAFGESIGAEGGKRAVNNNFFDIAAAAQGYSQLCGLMAGFSFAVLVWLVERLNLKDANTEEDVLVIRALVYLGVTFLGNLLVSFFWALVAGEARPETNRPQSLAYIATWLMALLAPMTMQSMTLVIATTGSRYATVLFRRVFFVTALIALVFLWTETSGVELVYRRATLEASRPTLPTTLLVAQVASYAVALAGVALSQRPTNRRFRLDTEASFANYTTAILGAMLIGALAFSQIAVASPGTFLLDTTLVVANLTWAAMLAWSCAFLPRE